jgi:hypothetical protein
MQDLVNAIRNGLKTYGSISVPASALASRGTSVGALMVKLDWRVEGIDVRRAGLDTDTLTFSKGCQHTRIKETYTRVSGTSYRVRQFCQRCGTVTELTRFGGEAADSKVVTKVGHLPLPGDYEYSEAELAGQQGEGGNAQGSPSPYQPKGQGEGEGEGNDKGGQGGGNGDQQQEGDSGNGEGDGDGEDGAGDGAGDSGGEGGGSEADSNEGNGGDQCEAEGPEGEVEGTGGDDGEGEGEGGSGDGEGEGEDPFIAAFKRHWELILNEDQKAGIYGRIGHLATLEAGND